MFRSSLSSCVRNGLLPVIVLVASAGALHAATGSIAGTVCDQKGHPLRFANVVVLQSTFGAHTGPSGCFRIDNVPVGRYRVQASYIGYEALTRDVTVRAGDVTEVSFCGGDAEGPSGPIPTPGCGEMWRVGGKRQRLPLSRTHVHVSVSGNMSHAVVEQHFGNPYTEPIEAVYVFPLPHKAAVHAMSIRIGERLLEAQIRKRQEAREVYTAARREGRMAALLEQERPNIFTQQVANIMPGHDIVVRLEYTEQLECQDGRFDVVVPTVVGPRFIPHGSPVATVLPATFSGHPSPSVSPTVSPPVSPPGSGWSVDTPRVPDASRITPPVLQPGADAGHRIRIDVELDAGVPLADVESVNHSVHIERPDAQRAIVSTRASDALANKDFVLRYRTRTGRPALGLLTHRAPDARFGYFTLILEPPVPPASAPREARELVLVLDTSGSMSGAPIEALKGFVRWVLRRLEPQDAFNIITFSNGARVYAPGLLVASDEAVQAAVRYVEGLRGGGGTQMRTGLEAAFDLASGRARRTCCLVTDGLIGNDDELLALVRSRIGTDRLFAIGIGSSPNRFLVDGLAEEGTGAQDFLGLDEDPRVAVDRFFRRIDSPVVGDLHVDWDGLQVEDVQPAVLPDLYQGEVLRVTGRYRHAGRGRITVRGSWGDRPFEESLQGTLPEQQQAHAELRVLWARQAIHELQRLQRSGDAAAGDRIEALGLQFAMLTERTSFVVADNQVVNDAGQPQLVPQPVEMPQGLRHETIFGHGLRQGVAGQMSSITVTGDPKRVTVKSGGVAHEESSSRSFAASEAVDEAVALNSGVVVQGQAKHVRGGRSAGVRYRSLGARTKQARLAVDIALVNTSVALGEAIQLRIRIENDQAQPVTLPDDYRLEDLSLVAMVQRGDEILPAPVSAPVAQPEGTSAAKAPMRMLAPGERVEFLVTLNGPDGFAFDRRGSYRIEILWLRGVRLPAETRIHVVDVR